MCNSNVEPKTADKKFRMINLGAFGAYLQINMPDLVQTRFTTNQTISKQELQVQSATFSFSTAYGKVLALSQNLDLIYFYHMFGHYNTVVKIYTPLSAAILILCVIMHVMA